VKAKRRGPIETESVAKTIRAGTLEELAFAYEDAAELAATKRLDQPFFLFIGRYPEYIRSPAQ
jgi:hypothetical protein